MAQTATRPGFRLPRTADPAGPESPAHGAETADQDTETPHMIDALTPSSANAPTTPPAGVTQAVGFDAVADERPATPKRQSKLMADLSRAMQAAAEHAATRR